MRLTSLKLINPQVLYHAMEFTSRNKIYYLCAHTKNYVTDQTSSIVSMARSKLEKTKAG